MKLTQKFNNRRKWVGAILPAAPESCDPEQDEPDQEYIQYCIELEQTLKLLEAHLHDSDDPQEIGQSVLKTACEFYGGDWCGILEVDLDLGLWKPVWWYNAGHQDNTLAKLMQFEAAEFMPTWVQAMRENLPVIVEDIEAVQETQPQEYSVYQRLNLHSTIAVPFKPNPTGFLAVRNPTKHIHQTSMLSNLAYVAHRTLAQQKTMDSSKMTFSPASIKSDADVIIHLFGNLEVYTSRGVIREADFKSPKICKMLAYLVLNRKSMITPWKMTEILWPDDGTDPDNPGKNIKYLLYRLRQMFGLISDYQLVESCASGYQLNPKLNIITDLDMFDKYRESAQQTNSISYRMEMLKKAIELYDGHVFSSASREDWVMLTANHYSLAYQGVVNELMKTLAGTKDYASVIQYSSKALQIEPGNVRAYYWRVYALAQTGATEMAKAALSMAKRNLNEEEHAELVKALQDGERKIPFLKSKYDGIGL